MKFNCIECKAGFETNKIVGSLVCPTCIKRRKNMYEMQSKNNGGSTDYYKLPEGASELQDLIEAKEMNFAIGNIFKATYRLGGEHHSDSIRDLNKIIFFAKRELERLKKLGL